MGGTGVGPPPPPLSHFNMHYIWVPFIDQLEYSWIQITTPTKVLILEKTTVYKNINGAIKYNLCQ